MKDRLIFQLKREVKEQYGCELDLKSVLQEASRNMTASGKFTATEIAMAQEFYSQLIEPEIRTCNASHFGKKHKHKNKHKHKSAKQPELMLPDGLALAFVCILGGSLLCVLPFGITQGLGTGLIVHGLVQVATESAKGEKPYYVDSETGQRIPDNPNIGPSIGVGTPF